MSSTPFRVTRIDHSCVLLQFGQATVLTDPWFSEKVFYHPGEPIAMSPEQLPELSAVLVSHAHYDHCDFKAFGAYRNHDVPILAARTVVKPATDAGFSNVTVLEEWESRRVKHLTITAIPAKHAVYEIGFMIQGGGRTVYFAADTMLIPELSRIPERFPHIDLALLPTNGLKLRPMLNRQVVMNADEAARLTAILKPDLAIPQHYAFDGGVVGNRLITKSDPDPEHYRTAAAKLAPSTQVRILPPGQPLDLGSVLTSAVHRV